MRVTGIRRTQPLPVSATAAPVSAAADEVTAQRREMKFVFDGSCVDALRDVLEVNARRVAFGDGPVSNVNSIYFDDARLSSAAESLAGVSRRVKLRLRWYDEKFARQRLFFEVKRRSGQVISKDRTPLDAPEVIDRIPYDDLLAWLGQALAPEPAAWLNLRPIPTTIVSYQREHFRDRDSSIRITLDYQIEAYTQLGLQRPARRSGVALDRLAVVEVKTLAADEHNVRRLLFPLKPRLARCSKYVHCCLANGLGSALRVHD
jgi:hypothetical protein